MKKFLFALLVPFLIFSCTQEEPDPVISIDGKTTYSVSEAAANIQIKVTSNTSDWGVDLGESASWITVASAQGDVLSLDVSANDTPASRRAVITVFAPKTGTAKSSASVVVMQSALEPQLNFDRSLDIEAEAAASRVELGVTTNMQAFAAVPEVEWIRASASGSKLILEIEANPADQPRSGIVKVYAPDVNSFQIVRQLNVTQAPADIEYPRENLSAEASSNCYLITHKGQYSFNALVRGNGKTVSGLKAPETLSPSSASLVWQSVPGMIKSVAYESGEIVFEADRKCGNALIAALDKSGNIIWSWHIWYPEVQVESLHTDTDADLMNINLGAMHNSSDNVGSYGLLYQWGRKDPFPGSPIMSGGSTFTKNVEVYDIDGKVFSIQASNMYSLKENTLEYSISHPYVCLSNNQQFSMSRDWLQPGESNLALWGNPNGDKHSGGVYPNKGSKTYYDPCPAGWRVPYVSVFKTLTSTGGMVWMVDGSWYELYGPASVGFKDITGDGKVDIQDYENGWYYVVNSESGAYTYLPATTRYDGQYALLMGSMVGLWGNYWVNSPSLNSDGSDAYLGNGISFGVKTYEQKESISASAMASGSRADAYAVRCIKE